jgi:hypothetical protein
MLPVDCNITVIITNPTIQLNVMNMLKVIKMENMTNVVKLDEIIKSVEISKLDDNVKMKDIIAKVNEMIDVINATKAPKVRDRGPESKREMDENDARRILLGDLKDDSHKSAAEKLELSYGQIYSARKGFTFKGVYKEFRDAQ